MLSRSETGIHRDRADGTHQLDGDDDDPHGGISVHHEKIQYVNFDFVLDIRAESCILTPMID